MRKIVAQPFYTVEEAAAFYVTHGGHGIVTHTIRGKVDSQCPPDAISDPAWLVEVFVIVTEAEIEEHAAIKSMMAAGAPDEETARAFYRKVEAAADKAETEVYGEDDEPDDTARRDSERTMYARTDAEDAEPPNQIDTQYGGDDYFSYMD